MTTFNRVAKVAPRVSFAAAALISILSCWNYAKADDAWADWRLLPDSGSGEVRTDEFYTLKNRVTGDAVTYGVREYGINLVWTEDLQSENVRLEVESGHGKTIRYGDKIAILVKGGGYLHYAERPHGINLTWSKEPTFEWRVDGGEHGTTFKSDTKFGLRNEIANDYVVYGKRNRGINLVWFKDGPQTWDRRLAKLGCKVIESKLDFNPCDYLE